jgi:hypothetical protein
MGILIFKGLTARRLYKSFGIKGLIIHVTPSVIQGQGFAILGPVQAGFVPHPTSHLLGPFLWL